MTNAWRAAGLTYIQYSNICAKVLRQGLKAELRAEAAKREVSHVKFNPWENGKPLRKATVE
ncbi:protein stunted-like isoform X1 [Episyrphus balteatus]|uniref:protein stunted-like isoform X1 n=1 Tax=Episyrphus balteatus TaxID=286459 RepID=UPI0024861D13|nr:protein stunted-like isoform X1 [Episyrphus balteatus]